MKMETLEFAPLETDRAEELREIINRATREKQAVVIDPEEGGVTGSAPADWLEPNENVNGLVRYRRHY